MFGEVVDGFFLEESEADLVTVSISYYISNTLSNDHALRDTL